MERVKDQSVFYVYALKDPRSNPARPFYIGKGVALGRSRSVIVPSGVVEKAQIALEHLKSAVFETTQANKEGVTNYEVAKCLGLQSDYGGGSKNYLSYSVLGIFMREGKVKRLQNKKHTAAVR